MVHTFASNFVHSSQIK